MFSINYIIMNAYKTMFFKKHFYKDQEELKCLNFNVDE